MSSIKQFAFISIGILGFLATSVHLHKLLVFVGFPKRAKCTTPLLKMRWMDTLLFQSENVDILNLFQYTMGNKIKNKTKTKIETKIFWKLKPN